MKPPRDEKHRAFIRSLPCSVPRCLATFIECCHIGPHGMSQKASDYSTGPLCRKHHKECDANPRAFTAKYGISMPAIARRLTQKIVMRVEAGHFAAYFETERYVAGPVEIGAWQAWERAQRYFRAWWRETLIAERSEPVHKFVESQDLDRVKSGAA